MKTLRTKPVYKLYFRYKNITLWKNKTITNLTKKKWMLLKASKTSILQYNRGIYLYHYKKLNLTRLYYYKFINKQLLKKYLINYNESSFKSILLKNFQIFEKRLDFNLYQAHFVPSLYAARFFITKGYILVNKCVIKNTNFLLKAHDLVEINPKFWVNNFAIINKNKIFENKVTFLYLRNIEIDYTTLSFIFLDNKQFYIIQFENFIKKIYFNLNQKKLFNSTNKTNVLNNYFKFFETTFNYYLFLDESNKNLKYKIKTNNFRVLNLLKYLRFYYNDYFFRNILLKRIFSYKYNYLNYISKALIHYIKSHFYDIENHDIELDYKIKGFEDRELIKIGQKLITLEKEKYIDGYQIKDEIVDFAKAVCENTNIISMDVIMDCGFRWKNYYASLTSIWIYLPKYVYGEEEVEEY
mgnify:CR=1 FL=1